MGKIQNNICYESQCCRVLNEKLHIVKVNENACGGKNQIWQVNIGRFYEDL